MDWFGDSGLYSPELFNFETGETRRIGIAFRKNKKAKGLWFNVCPFCGEKILNDKKQLNTDRIPYYPEVKEGDSE